MDRLNSLYRFESLFPKLLIATTVFYFLKVMFWPITYLFILAYFILIVVFLFKSNMKFKLKGFYLAFWPTIILASVFLLVFIFSDQYSNSVLQRGILRLLILFSLFYLFYWSIIVKNLSIEKNYIFKFIIAIITFIAVLNIIILIFPNIISSEIMQKYNIGDELSISNDRNFFSLFIILALLIINYNKFARLKISFLSNTVTIFLNLLFIINIILSASRRGTIIFFILLLVYIIWSIIQMLNNFNLKDFIKKITYFLFVSIFLIIVGLVIFKKIPKDKVNSMIYQYSTLLNLNNTYIERLLWEKQITSIPDGNIIINNTLFSKEPSNWASPASIKNELLQVTTPYGLGYKISTANNNKHDYVLEYKGSKIMYYANHMYKISVKVKYIEGKDPIFIGWRKVPFWENRESRGIYSLPIRKKKLDNGWWQYTAFYTFNNNNIWSDGFLVSNSKNAEFIIADFNLEDLDYNFKLPKFASEMREIKNLNEWMQEKNPTVLNDTNLINNGNFSSGLKYWNFNANEVSISLEKIDGKQCAKISRGKGNGIYWSLLYYGRSILFKAKNEYQISFKIKLIKPLNKLPFSVGFYINEGNGYMTNLKKQIDTLKNGWLNVKVKYRFIKDSKHIGYLINNQLSYSEFYITDIKLENLSQVQIQVKNVKKLKLNISNQDALFSPRTSRWLFAKELWDTKYNLKNKLFGHGFNYLEWYGEKFYKDSKRYDWPHNPLISVLLYSGIIGLILYIWLLIKVIKIYIKYRKEQGLLFLGFLIVLSFAFFSGNSPFSPPIMGFFIMLPFLIHTVYKRDSENKPEIIKT